MGPLIFSSDCIRWGRKQSSTEHKNYARDEKDGAWTSGESDHFKSSQEEGQASSFEYNDAMVIRPARLHETPDAELINPGENAEQRSDDEKSCSERERDCHGEPP